MHLLACGLVVTFALVAKYGYTAFVVTHYHA